MYYGVWLSVKSLLKRRLANLRHEYTRELPKQAQRIEAQKCLSHNGVQDMSLLGP